MSVEYCHAAGGDHTPETPVTDPKDWFEHVRDEYFDKFKELYDSEAATDDQKTFLKTLLGENAMESADEFGDAISMFNDQKYAEKYNALRKTFPQMFHRPDAVQAQDAQAANGE